MSAFFCIFLKNLLKRRASPRISPFRFLPTVQILTSRDDLYFSINSLYLGFNFFNFAAWSLEDGVRFISPYLQDSKSPRSESNHLCYRHVLSCVRENEALIIKNYFTNSLDCIRHLIKIFFLELVIPHFHKKITIPR